jgi:hypothetical protein
VFDLRNDTFVDDGLFLRAVPAAISEIGASRNDNNSDVTADGRTQGIK